MTAVTGQVMTYTREPPHAPCFLHAQGGFHLLSKLALKFVSYAERVFKFCVLKTPNTSITNQKRLKEITVKEVRHHFAEILYWRGIVWQSQFEFG